MIIINFAITIISDNFAKAREEAKKIKAVSMFKHLKNEFLTFVPKKESQIGPIIDSDKFQAIRKRAFENKNLSTKT